MTSILTLLLASCLAHGAEPITLTEVFAAASDAPETVLAEVDRALGLAERMGARALPNPSIEYQGYARTRGTSDAINGQQHQVDVVFALPITGEFAARVRRGQLGEVLGRARATTRLSLLAEALATAWLELLAAQEREGVLDGASERVDQLVDVAQRRADEGAARPWDADRMRLVQASVDRQRALVAQERLTASATLSALLAMEAADLTATGDLAALLDLPAPAAGRDAPFVDEARAEVAYREQAAREVRRSRLPEPEIRFGSYSTRDGDSLSVVGGLRLDVPLFDLGRGPVMQAKAEQLEAESSLRQAEAWLDSERDATRRSASELRALVGASTPSQGEVSLAAEVAWREGETGILELVDAISAEVENDLEAIDVLLALQRTELRGAFLDGRLAEVVASAQ